MKSKKKKASLTQKSMNTKCAKLLPPSQQKGLFLPKNESVDEWCNKYQLEIISGSCEECGDQIIVNVPCFFQDYIGLVANPCKSCGKASPLAVLRPHSERTKRIFSIF